MRNVFNKRLWLAPLCAAAAVAILAGSSSTHNKHLRQVPAPVVTGKESEPDYNEVISYLTKLRAWPYERIDNVLYEKASYKSRPVSVDGGATWQYVGPKNNPGTGGLYYGPGPVSGRVNGIAFGSSLPDAAIYVTTPGGGVQESRDGGTTWIPLSDDWDTMNTTAVAVNPNNPNILLVGTGDYHGKLSTGAIGIMKGTFAGGSWAFTNVGRTEIAGAAVSKILFDPENPNIVLATTGRGAGLSGASEGNGKIFRSTNGGDTWTPVVGDLAPDQRPWNNVVCGAMSPATGRRIYYAVGNGTGNVLLRSIDKGRTWQPVGAVPTGLVGGDYGGLDVAASPVFPETVYLMSAIDRRIWKSTNGGQNWSLLVGPAAADRHGFPFDAPGTNNYNFSQRSYDWFLASGSHLNAAGRPVDDVYAGLITVAASTDGGATWMDIGATYQATAKTHNDQHSLAFKPGNNAEPWLGNDGGIYKLTYDTAAGTFMFDPSKNRDLYITQFYHADWDKQTPQPDIMLGGTQDNGTPYSNASPPAWQPNLSFGDGSGAGISANNRNYQYAGGYFNAPAFSFRATSDLWNAVQDNDDCVFYGGQLALFFPPLKSDPNNRNIAYTASNKLWQYSYTRSMVAEAVTAAANSATQQVTSSAGMFVGQILAFYRYNTATMQYVTGANYRRVVAIPNGTSVTVDMAINTAVGANEQWNVFGGRWAETTGNRVLGDFVLSIAVAQGDPLLIYTGSRNGQFWRSNDAGSTNANWFDVSGNLPNRPISDIAVNPANKNRVWITMQGASTTFRVASTTTNRGPIFWKALGGNGLPDVPANCVAVDPDNPNKNIFVGTDKGLYISDNGGANWRHANSNAATTMPANVMVTDVEVVGTGATRTLNVSTFGRGIWRVVVDEL